MLEERSENFPGDRLDAKVEDDDDVGGDPADADVETQLETTEDDPSSDSLWFGAVVIGGGGGADDWTPDPEPYKFDKLFIVMAELWFQ